MKSHARWPWMLALFTAVAGLAITGYVWDRLAAREEAEALERFRLEAETLRVNTEQELHRFVEVLDSIRALHGISGEIRSEALEEFVEKGMVHQREVLGAFGFAQRISHGLREALEEAYREAEELGYQIVRRGPDDTWVPSEVNPVYFPLTWQSRPDALQAPVGFDFASRTAARQAIERMHISARAALVLEPAHGEREPPRRHWVFSPIFYEPDDDGGASDILIGFAVAVLNPEEILARASAMVVPSPGLRLDLAPGTADDPAEAMVQRVEGEWRYRYSIEVVDTPWRFECRLPVSIPGRRSGGALVVGLLITALMTSQMALIAGRTRRIEDEVRLRTEDLRRTKAEVEAQMRERMRLEEEMNDLAANERRKLGRDLHDSLGQKLTAAVFLSRSLLSHFRESRDAQEPHAQTLNETLKEAVGQVRAMAKGLAPITLSDENLGEALAELADEMTDLYGVSCEVGALIDDTGLDARTKEQLYLIAREAANNAARHADPGRVTIDMRRTEQDGVELVVEDDGTGMPDTAANGSGMGLRIMRHRAQMIGADLRYEPGAHGGTRVVCRIRGR